MENNNTQGLFFQQIKTLLSPHISFVDEIAGVLEISTDSAYRRIRGEKPISFEEIQKLSSRYNLSIDQFLHLQNNNFVFTGNLGYNPEEFIEEYLNNMLQQFEYMRSFEHKHIYSLPKDILPFVYFHVPELSAFTFFYYQKSLLHYDEMKDLKFSVKNLNDKHKSLRLKVQESFNQIPSTELWSIDTIDSILSHISFYRDTNVFESKEDIYCLYDKLEELITHIEKQAELGLKFTNGKSPDKNTAPLRMFYNNLVTGDNCVLAEVGDFKVTFINHNLINFMFTRDVGFNNYTHLTFQNVIRKSTQISLTGEKARARFFDLLRRKIHLKREANNHYV